MKPTTEDKKLASDLRTIIKGGDMGDPIVKLEKEIDLLGVVLKAFTVVALVIVAVYSLYSL